MIAAVVVTYNRSKLLQKAVRSLLVQERVGFDKIYIVNNASTDDTASVIEDLVKSSPAGVIVPVTLNENLGGAGGFHYGAQKAYKEGAQWIALLDDDVAFAPDCLENLLKHADDYKCMLAVREDLQGELQEYAALQYDLKNPCRLNPRVISVKKQWGTRSAMPEVVEVDAGSFEGFFINREVVEKIGFPRKEFFIYSDDFDYSLRARKTGYKIGAVRDARCIRQLPYSSAKFGSWKTYYVWRNFFILHFVHGENVLVRLKPYAFYALLWALKITGKKVGNPNKILIDAQAIARSIQ